MWSAAFGRTQASALAKREEQHSPESLRLSVLRCQENHGPLRDGIGFLPILTADVAHLRAYHRASVAGRGISATPRRSHSR